MSKYNRQSTRGLHTGSKAWREIRAKVLAEQPLCEMCEKIGRVAPATDVDHIDNNSHNQSRDNLQGLCREHHSEKTAAEAIGREFVLKGCSPDGTPYHRQR